MSVTWLDNPGKSVLLRWILDHLDYPHDYCLMWPFGRNSAGYGTVGNAELKRVYAHRLICERIHGPAPEGYQAAHSCGRGHHGCVNPRHLSWKSPSENQMDRARHGTVHLGRKPKLTHQQATEILAAKGKELPQVTAKRFKITEANVRQIQTGKTWQHLERVA